MKDKSMQRMGGRARLEKYGTEGMRDMARKAVEANLAKYGPDAYREMQKKGMETRRANKARRDAEKGLDTPASR